MKIIIEFNEEELDQAKAAMDPLKYKYVVEDMLKYFRNILKYRDDLFYEARKELEAAREHLLNLSKDQE